MIAPIPFARPGCSCPACERHRAMDRAARRREVALWVATAVAIVAAVGLLVGGWAGAGI